MIEVLDGFSTPRQMTHLLRDLGPQHLGVGTPECGTLGLLGRARGGRGVAHQQHCKGTSVDINHRGL